MYQVNNQWECRHCDVLCSGSDPAVWYDRGDIVVDPASVLVANHHTPWEVGQSNMNLHPSTALLYVAYMLNKRAACVFRGASLHDVGMPWRAG